MRKLPARLWMHPPRSRKVRWPYRDQACLWQPPSQSLVYPAVAHRNDYVARAGINFSIEGHQDGKWTIGYVLLCAATNNIFRLGFADNGASRIIKGWKRTRSQLPVDPLPDALAADLPVLENELLKLYDHTQKQLKAHDATYVRLYRNLGSGLYEKVKVNISSPKFWDTINSDYDLELLRAFLSCRALGREYISLPMDLLNSFGDDGAYGHFDIKTHVDVNSELILYTERFFGAPHPKSASEYSIERNEWVVICPAPDGRAVISLDKDAFLLSERLESLILHVQFDEADASRYLEDWECSKQFR